MTYPQIGGVAAAHAVNVHKPSRSALDHAVVSRIRACSSGFDGSGLDDWDLRKGSSQGNESEESRELHFEGLMLLFFVVFVVVLVEGWRRVSMMRGEEEEAYIYRRNEDEWIQK